MVVSWEEHMESQTDKNAEFLEASFMEKAHGEPAGQRHRHLISFRYGQNTWRARTTQAQTTYKLLS
jgi:hypothetical protein